MLFRMLFKGQVFGGKWKAE